MTPRTPYLMAAAFGLGIALCLIAHDARADGTPSSYDQLQAAVCPPQPQTAWERAPQAWAGVPPETYAEYVRDPGYGVIKYPPHGTGGSGGHSPEPEPPAPVPLPAAGGLLAAALGILFAAWRKFG